MSDGATSRRPREARESEPPPTALRPEALPPEFRTLRDILLVDLVFGFWIARLFQSGLAVLTIQVPVLGVAGLAWGFLPSASKDVFGRWLAELLGRRSVRWSVRAVGATLFASTLLMSTVAVDLADSATSTVVHLVTGPEYHRGGSGPPEGRVLRLNRRTAPVEFLSTPLLARSVWLYTPTMVSRRSERVLPWRRAAFEYPEDFEPMVSIAVLPGEPYFSQLEARRLRLLVRERDERRDTLATVTMDSVRGYSLGFSRPSPVDPPVKDRWEKMLATDFPDSGGRAFVLQKWGNLAPAFVRRPLRIGEWVRWELHGEDGTLLKAGDLRLDDAISDLYLRE
jgi:hypothetical protein